MRTTTSSVFKNSMAGFDCAQAWTMTGMTIIEFALVFRVWSKRFCGVGDMGRGPRVVMGG